MEVSERPPGGDGAPKNVLAFDEDQLRKIRADQSETVRLV